MITLHFFILMEEYILYKGKDDEKILDVKIIKYDLIERNIPYRIEEWCITTNCDNYRFISTKYHIGVEVW